MCQPFLSVQLSGERLRDDSDTVNETLGLVTRQHKHGVAVVEGGCGEEQSLDVAVDWQVAHDGGTLSSSKESLGGPLLGAELSCSELGLGSSNNRILHGVQFLAEGVGASDGKDTGGDLARDGRDLLLHLLRAQALSLGSAKLKSSRGIMSLGSGSTSDSNQTAHALADALLSNNSEAQCLAEVVQVGATAELHRPAQPLLAVGIGEHGVDGLANRHDADGVGVHLAEHGAEGADATSLRKAARLPVDLGLEVNQRLDDVLDLGALLGGDGLVPGEVKSQALLGHHGAALVQSFPAKHSAQRAVQCVGRGVVGSNGGAALVVDAHGDLLADRQGAGVHGANVDHVRPELLAVGDGLLAAISGEGANVVDLAPSLGVEGGCVEDDADNGVVGSLVHPLLASPNSADLGSQIRTRAGGNPVILRLVIGGRHTHWSTQGRGLFGLEDNLHAAVAVRGLLLRLLLLALHGSLVPDNVDSQVALFGHKLGQVQRETVSVV
mmetsp:Transcript_147/g.457  ORF Transcript_147/g.457 Transcript_147/m.457 type:complete len:495 (+) Transcript_147:383-1867(+)